MEQNKIEFREIRSSDYISLEKIIRDTWKYERFCSPKTAKQMSKSFLAGCLANQDFTCVAVNNGEPVGVIMGKDELHHHTSFRHFARLLISAAAMLISKEGRRVSKMYQGFETLDKELLKESGQSFGGELAFFAIRSDQRGTGIGKELFNRVQNFMKSKNIRNFYLYTDTACNFGFYEHQGMKRINERKHNRVLNPDSKEKMTFFLYGYEFNE